MWIAGGCHPDRGEGSARDDAIARFARDDTSIAYLVSAMNVEHDESGHRFVIRLPDGMGQLIYRVPREGVIDLHHTDVDAALQGQGVAAALAQAAFDHVRAHGMKAVVTCPYVRAWLKRHPEQRDLVVV